ncbi:hypothetical protein IFR04_004969 [Cadophora malorum]|uniref:Uncharacterized protein n=1 Tax=Cadophora malorum TaxID=108018 RepID=A0A8H7WBN7_9HELO|nr:hypothetical protein IFR04_004969 [Cadophora malorum]
MCIIELIACEDHGAIIRFHDLCPDIGDPLTCPRVMHKQRLGVSYPQENCARGHINALNHEIAARTSEMDNLKLDIRGIVSQTKAALKLFEQASTACKHLTQLFSQKEELQLEQSLLQMGLVDIHLKGQSRPEQETKWQVQLLQDAGGFGDGAAEALVEASRVYQGSEGYCAETNRQRRWRRLVWNLRLQRI